MASFDLTPADSGSTRRLSDLVETLLRENDVPGASVAVLVDGQPRVRAGYGKARIDAATPLDADASFYVYSITKTFTAIATLQLAEQDRITLDAPVRTYLPDPALPERVTIRQLLNHTGGIPDYGGMPEYHEAVRTNPDQPWTGIEFLERILPGGLAYEPGQGWGYSNIGYLVLKLLLERVHGQPLRDILREAIFDRLDLKQTFVAENLDDARVLTPGYSTFLSSGDELSDVAPRYHPGWVSHGVVISTASEIARIYEALFSGRLLSSSSLAAMLEPVPVPANHPLFSQPCYGLGLMIDPGSLHGTVAGHGGGGPGYSTGAIHLSDLNGHRVTSVAFINSDRGDLGLRVALTAAEQAAET